MAAQGRDIKLSPQRVEGYRNFATKLWNAARFAEMNGCVTRRRASIRRHAKETLNRWIAHETAKATREVTAAIEAYKFNEAADAAYRFVWNVYLRLVCGTGRSRCSPAPDGAGQGRDARHGGLGARRDPQAAAPVHAVHHRGAVARHRRGADRSATRCWCSRLAAARRLDDAEAEAEIGWLIDLVTAIRSVRAEMNITGDAIPLVLVGASAETQARAARWAEFVKRLARVAEITFADARAAGLGAACHSRRGRGAAAQGRDRSSPPSSARLDKEMAKAEADIARVDAKLGNPDFVAARARRGGRRRAREARGGGGRRAKILEALERLKGARKDQPRSPGGLPWRWRRA